MKIIGIGKNYNDHIKEMQEGKISKEEAASKIADIYGGFCRFWLESRN